METTTPAQTPDPTQELEMEVQEIAEPLPAQKPGRIGNAWAKAKSFIVELRRVIRVTKKPEREEFKSILKIAGLGIGVIGLLGFVIHIIRELLF